MWVEEHTGLAGGGDEHVTLQGCATRPPEKVHSFALSQAACRCPFSWPLGEEER